MTWFGTQTDSIQIENVTPGRYWVDVYPTNGYAASVTAGGVDLLHHPLVVPSGSSATFHRSNPAKRQRNHRRCGRRRERSYRSRGSHLARTLWLGRAVGSGFQCACLFHSVN